MGLSSKYDRAVRFAGGACAALSTALFIWAGCSYWEHLAARRYLKEVALSVTENIPPGDVRGQVTALRDFIRSSVSYYNVPQSGRPFLRDSADETLRSRRGWCGEVSRAFICLATELSIPAQRINLSGAEKHTVAEAQLSPTESLIVDSQSPPTIQDLELLDKVMLRGTYSEYYSVNLERLRLRRFISRIKLEPGPLTYWIECPRLIKATMGSLGGSLLGVCGLALLWLARRRRLTP